MTPLSSKGYIEDMRLSKKRRKKEKKKEKKENEKDENKDRPCSHKNFPSANEERDTF